MDLKVPLCITLLLVSITSLNATAQQAAQPDGLNSWAHSSKNCHHLLSNSYQCGWKIFNIKGSLEGTLVTYSAGQKDNRGLTTASVAIVKTKKDTVRLLLLSYGTHKAGETIKIVPADEPAADVAVPLDKDYYLAEEKRGHKPTFRINQYDEHIIKTAWGKLEGE